MSLRFRYVRSVGHAASCTVERAAATRRGAKFSLHGLRRELPELRGASVVRDRLMQHPAACVGSSLTQINSASSAQVPSS